MFCVTCFYFAASIYISWDFFFFYCLHFNFKRCNANVQKIHASLPLLRSSSPSLYTRRARNTCDARRRSCGIPEAVVGLPKDSHLENNEQQIWRVSTLKFSVARPTVNGLPAVVAALSPGRLSLMLRVEKRCVSFIAWSCMLCWCQWSLLRAMTMFGRAKDKNQYIIQGTV